MALNLDTRQRAMLQDMGITIWWPKPAAGAPVRKATHSATEAPAAATLPAAR